MTYRRARTFDTFSPAHFPPMSDQAVNPMRDIAGETLLLGQGHGDFRELDYRISQHSRQLDASTSFASSTTPASETHRSLPAEARYDDRLIQSSAYTVPTPYEPIYAGEPGCWYGGGRIDQRECGQEIYRTSDQSGNEYRERDRWTDGTDKRSPSTPHTFRPAKGTGFAHRIWMWEILASVLSMAAIASVAVVLAYEQGKPLDQWRRGPGRVISPTAVVSFLGTIGKSACLAAVTEIISQLKWIHFQDRSRRLRDLQLFDNASRGPWGAALLVIHKNRTALLAVCASLITLGALLIDPFLQLVFDFPSRLTTVASSAPNIASTRVYDPFQLPSRWGQCYGPSQVDSTMQAAILSPIWKATPPPSLPCNFERCEWQTITTLGACSSCIDLTNTVVPKCKQINSLHGECNYTIPTTGITLGAQFGVTGGAAEMTSYSTLWNSVASQSYWGSENLIPQGPVHLTNFTFIKFDDLD